MTLSNVIHAMKGLCLNMDRRQINLYQYLDKLAYYVCSEVILEMTYATPAFDRLHMQI